MTPPQACVKREPGRAAGRSRRSARRGPRRSPGARRTPPRSRWRSGRSRRTRPTGCGRRGWCGSSGTGCRRRRCPRGPPSRSTARCAGGQRLGHQCVVVDRDRHQPQPAEQRRVRVGGEHDALGLHAPVPGVYGDPGTRPGQRGDRGLLRDAYAGPQARVAQSPRQPGRLEDRGIRVVHPGQEGRRVDPLPQRLGGEPGRGHPVRPRLVVLLPERLDLVGLRGHREASRRGRSRSRCRARARSARCRRGSPGPSRSSGRARRASGRARCRSRGSGSPRRSRRCDRSRRARTSRPRAAARRARGRAPWRAARSRARSTRHPRRRGRPSRARRAGPGPAAHRGAPGRRASTAWGWPRPVTARPGTGRHQGSRERLLLPPAVELGPDHDRDRDHEHQRCRSR